MITRKDPPVLRSSASKSLNAEPVTLKSIPIVSNTTLAIGASVDFNDFDETSFKLQIDIVDEKPVPFSNNNILENFDQAESTMDSKSIANNVILDDFEHSNEKNNENVLEMAPSELSTSKEIKIEEINQNKNYSKTTTENSKVVYASALFNNMFS